jgi:phage shock protein A
MADESAALTVLERLAALEVEVRALDRRVSAHGEQLDDHGPRVDRLERVVGEVLARLAALDVRLSRIEARLLLGGGLIYVVVEVALRLLA